MAKKDNITPIGDGSIGISGKMNTGTGQEIEKLMSENNLRYHVRNNASIKNSFNGIMKMVSRWAFEDKMIILRQYGSLDYKNVNKNNIDEILTETLIANLPQDEVKRILGNITATEKQLVKDIRTTDAATRAKAKRYFNIKNLQEKYILYGKTASNDKQLLKMLNSESNKFSVDKIFRKDALPNLRKELDQLLRNYTKMDLGALAYEVEADFEDGSSEKLVRTSIINKVNMYVALVLGKTKGVSVVSMPYNVIEAIEDLLRMTSFAWVTGEAAPTAKEFKDKRDKALAAKRIQDANQRLYRGRQQKGLKIKYGKFFGLFKKDTQNLKTKGSSSNKLVVDNAKLIKLFGNMTDEEIQGLALQIGIGEPELLSRAELEEAISYAIAGENSEINDVQSKIDKLSGKGNLSKKDKRKLRDYTASLNTLKKNSIVSNIFNSSKAKQEFSDQIPIVTFNEDGKISSEAILKAVPVYLVGIASSIGRLQSKEDIKKYSDAAKYGKMINETYELLNTKRLLGTDNVTAISGNNADSLALKNKIETYMANINSIIAGGANINEDTTALQQAILEDVDKMIHPNKGKINAGLASAQKVKTKKSASTTATVSLPKRKSMATSDAMKLTRRINLTKNTKNKNVAMFDDVVSKMAVSLFGTTKFANNEVSVIPVLDINKTHDYAPKQYDELVKIRDITGSMHTVVSQLPTLFAGLQSYMGTNTAGVNALLAKGLITADDLAGNMLSGLAFAKGGSMKAANTTKSAKVSKIITGDHPKGKNNTELVSVDWTNKNIDVKPIPAFANGGTARAKSLKSNVTSVNKMNYADRKAPLSISISDGLVKYNKTLNDVEDSGSTAVKVYSINTGINDKIKIGDTEISLFDSVYGIYASMPAILSSLNSNTQLLSTIAANTAASVKANSANSNASSFSFPTNFDSILSGR